MEITQQNFEDYFFDVRKHRPKPGQIMAKYTAYAEFVAGREKEDVLYLLKRDKAKEACLVMQKIHGAREPDSYRVCREMVEDLINGMSDKEVLEKPYGFVMEFFFYTQKECVPEGDPHWECIKLVQLGLDSQTDKEK